MKPTTNGVVLANGNGRHAEPSDEHALALALARVVHGCKVSGKTRHLIENANPPEWRDLLRGLSESSGLITPESRLDWLTKFVRGMKVPADLRKSIARAIQKAADEPPDDEPDDAGSPRPAFLDAIKGAREFDEAEFPLEWLVKNVIVADQPLVVGAPKKTMKTSIMVDLAVSLASATPFLGHFDVPRPTPVLMISGESGPAVLQETIRRVCRARELTVSDLERNLFVGGVLPQLGSEQEMAALAGYIRKNGIRVVIIDPLYLCLLQGSGGRRLDASNLYDLGPLLLAVCKACLDAGATPLLVHHFRKAGPDPSEMPELEDLAFSGVQEFARQWILLKRRERFAPGSGVHKLWLVAGGSAGHSGDYALDITEGTQGDDFTGRRWEVAIKAASDAWTEAKVTAETAKTELLAAKAKVKNEAKDREDSGFVVEMLGRLKAEPGRKATVNRIRALTGWNNDKALRILARAEVGGYIAQTTCEVFAGRNRQKVTPTAGYEWVRDPDL